MNGIEEAAKTIEADRRAREEGFKAAVQEAAIKYRCDIVAVPQIINGQIVAFVEIRAK